MRVSKFTNFVDLFEFSFCSSLRKLPDWKFQLAERSQTKRLGPRVLVKNRNDELAEWICKMNFERRLFNWRPSAAKIKSVHCAFQWNRNCLRFTEEFEILKFKMVWIIRINIFKLMSHLTTDLPRGSRPEPRWTMCSMTMHHHGLQLEMHHKNYAFEKLSYDHRLELQSSWF